MDDIIINTLSYRYFNSSHDILKNINLKIKAGEKIAIVGENGSGKSTFINLLCGLLRPCSGEIYMGNKKEKRDICNISAIFQDFACYDASIKFNVKLSNDSSQVENERILGLLNMLDFTHKKNESFLNDEIGVFSNEKYNLSGGQWQKIAIARALFDEESKILVLDEPTSALDPISEEKLYNNFIELAGDRTTFIVSHRLGIGKIVDRILVFKDGRIIEDGNHEELMKLKGEYYKMFSVQKEWYI